MDIKQLNYYTEYIFICHIAPW